MSDRSEKGFALIAVLWTVALLSIIAAVLSLESRTSLRISRNAAEVAAARAAADAGIQRAILNLLVDSEKFRPDGAVYAWEFANSTVHISVQDEASKVDLNQASEVLLAALFVLVGIDPGEAQSLAGAIADFRDPDNLPRVGGAEETQYQAAGLAWGPKNSAFEAIEELRRVLGMTPRIYEQVAPDLTVYSVAGAINPAVAGERLNGILRQVGVTSQSPITSSGAVYSIRAEAKGIHGAMFVREAVVQLILESVVPIRLLAWRQGAVKNSDSALELNAGE